MSRRTVILGSLAVLFVTSYVSYHHEWNTIQQQVLRNVHSASSPAVRKAPLEAAAVESDWKTRYQYHAPVPQHWNASLWCGPRPDYEHYFSKPRKRRRSANDEDRRLFELFVQSQSFFLERPTIVEIGAFDGLQESNSRFFEKCLGWDTLLIEANPNQYPHLVNNRPHAHRASFAASCPSNNNQTIPFHAVPWTNAAQHNVDHHAFTKKWTETTEVPCGSLTPVVNELWNGHVTIFSLDVEGAEPQVISNLDLQHLFIEVFLVESVNTYCQDTCASREETRRILQQHGYTLFQGLVTKSDLYIHPKSKFLQRMDQSTPSAFGPDLQSRYHYRPPQPRTESSEDVCGSAPNYQSYFRLPTKMQRSANHEDLTIYRWLFLDNNPNITYWQRPTVVEIGAFDGIQESNSRFFEECLGWETLLVEANPRKYQRLINNRPHAHCLSFAASCSDTPSNQTVEFYNVPWTNAAQGNVDNAFTNDTTRSTITVPCGSLTPVLQQLWGGHVTFFSLDVEGAEPQVIQHLDLDNLFIEVIMAENFNAFCSIEDDCASREETRRILTQEYGYQIFPDVVVKSDVYIHPQSKLLDLVRSKPLPRARRKHRTPSAAVSKPILLPSTPADSQVAGTLHSSPKIDTPAVPKEGGTDAVQSRFSPLLQARYQYHSPAAAKNESVAEDICGKVPDYDKYFAQNHLGRSANQEDKTIYDLFFKGNHNYTEQYQRHAVVEIGAFDGIRESNSRFFEECLGWDSLLIEANPSKYKELLKNRPGAHRVSFAASCSEEQAAQNETVQFYNVSWTNAAQGDVSNAYNDDNSVSTVSVPCGSLTPLLQDLFGGHVTFFSLDVEGAEPRVLSNLNLDELFIEVLIAESRNAFCSRKDCPARDEARKIMKDHGYHLFGRVVPKSDLYVHPKSKLLERLRSNSKRT